MKLFILTLIPALLATAPAMAGTWTCQTGADGKVIYQAVIKGDEQGNMAGSAILSVAGMPAGAMTVQPDKAAPDELVRVMITSPRHLSDIRLRVLAQAVQPNVYPAATLLVNFQIKKELEGTCTYAP